MTKTGKLLRKFRTAAGLTQKQLGKKMGVGGQSVSMVERGAVLLPKKHFKAVSKTLGVPTKVLNNAYLVDYSKTV